MIEYMINNVNIILSYIEELINMQNIKILLALINKYPNKINDSHYETILQDSINYENIELFILYSFKKFKLLSTIY